MQGSNHLVALGASLVGACSEQQRAHDPKIPQVHAQVLARLYEPVDFLSPISLVPQREEHHQPHPARAALQVIYRGIDLTQKLSARSSKM